MSIPRLVTASLAAICFMTAASAQQADPYADVYRQEQERRRLQEMDRLLDDVRYRLFAYGCQVVS